MLDDNKDKMKGEENKETDLNEEVMNKIYHPVKFNFKLLEVIDPQVENVKIERHESELI